MGSGSNAIDLVTGLASTAASLWGGQKAREGQESANESNERIALENRKFQMNMSNTAHVREVQDLKNAGLNPILSATGGSGASTPGGATATMQNEEAGTQAAVQNAVQNAMQLKLLSAQVGKIKQETKLIKEKTKPAEFVGTIADNANNAINKTIPNFLAGTEDHSAKAQEEAQRKHKAKAEKLNKSRYARKRQDIKRRVHEEKMRRKGKTW